MTNRHPQELPWAGLEPTKLYNLGRVLYRTMQAKGNQKYTRKLV